MTETEGTLPGMSSSFPEQVGVESDADVVPSLGGDVASTSSGADPWVKQGAVHLPSARTSFLQRPFTNKQAFREWFQDVELQDAFWSRNLPEDQSFGMKENLLVIFFPMFVGGLWTEDRKDDYRRLLKSFIFWVTIIQIVLFFFSLFPHGISSPLKNPTLGPPPESLVLFGAKDDDLLLAGHIYRFITPVLLHSGVFHLILNLFVQFRLALGFEAQWGFECFFFVFCASTFGGVSFSCLTTRDVNVASSSAMCGVIGARLAEIIITWKQESSKQRAMNIVTTLLLLMIILIVGFAPFVDNGAHFGGFLAGFVLGWAFFVPRVTDSEVYRLGTLFGSSVFLFAFYGICLCLFYGIRGLSSV